MKRRDFVGAVCAAPLAGTLVPRGQPAPIGIQLYTLRSLMEKDLEGTLAGVAEIGYQEVEFAGEFGRSAAQLRTILDRLGLRAPARHVDLNRATSLRTLEDSAALGNRFVVVAWVPQRVRGSVDAWKRLADRFNETGMAARRAGLRFAYHNHDFEFAAVGDRVPFDILLEWTDPTLVSFELDLYWIVKGGQDPLDYLRRGPGRYVMVHVKDMDRTAARGMTDPGEGIIDFATILPLAQDAGVRHFFVEHDQPADPWATARAGYRHLRSLLG